MSKTEIPAKAFVVVTTGAEAKFFTNAGHPNDIRLKSVGALKPHDLEDDGPSGKLPPDTSKREADEATFSKQLAAELYKKAYAKEFEALVIVADPDTLGELRPLLHREVTERLIATVPRTLIHHSLEDIARSLSNC